MQVITTIEDHIIGALKSFAKSAWQNDHLGATDWTNGIKKELIVLGKEYGFDSCATGHEDSREWLYDLVWYEYNHDRNHLVSIPLVMECEWTPKEVKYDFEKLLVTNAGLRLMIFQGKRDFYTNIMQEMRTGIDVYTMGRSGDRYLFAWLDDYDSGEFVFEGYIKK